MKTSRYVLLIASVLLSAALAFVARDLVRDLIVVPLSFLIWQLGELLKGVAQLVQWGILVVALALVLAWQLVPELKRPSRKTSGGRMAGGEVETMALGLLRAHASNYFKWQLAHRLGRVSRRLDELAGRNHDGAAPSTSVLEFLAAGLNHSFVDFPSRRHMFDRPTATPLDADPDQVITYLESRWFMNGKNHAESL